MSFQGVDSTAAAPLVICSFGTSVAVFDIRKGSNLKNPVTSFEAHSDDVTQVMGKREREIEREMERGRRRGLQRSLLSPIISFPFSYLLF